MLGPSLRMRKKLEYPQSVLEAKALTRLLHMLPDPHYSPMCSVALSYVLHERIQTVLSEGGPTQTRSFFLF